MGRRLLVAASLAALVLAAACVPPKGPAATLDAYARALDAGRLDRAYALTAPAYRRKVSRAAFGAHYATPAARRQGAAAARAAATDLVVAPASDPAHPVLEARGAGWGVLPPQGPIPSPGAAAAARAAAAAFVQAVDREDFQAAYAALSGALRARYTPARLARDYRAAASAARGAVDRVRAALTGGATVVVTADRAYLPLGGGQRLRLVLEAGAWHVAALR